MDHKRTQFSVGGAIGIIVMTNFLAPIDSVGNAYGAYVIGLLVAWAIKKYVPATAGSKKSGTPTPAAPCVTANHKVLTKRGWVEAQDLTRDDVLVQKASAEDEQAIQKYRFYVALVCGVIIYSLASVFPLGGAVAAYACGLFTIRYVRSFTVPEDDAAVTR